MMLTFKGNPGAICACVLFKGMNLCFVDCITRFFLLN